MNGARSNQEAQDVCPRCDHPHNSQMRCEEDCETCRSEREGEIELLDAAGLAELMGWSNVSTVHRMMAADRQGAIPPPDYRVGGHLTGKGYSRPAWMLRTILDWKRWRELAKSSAESELMDIGQIAREARVTTSEVQAWIADAARKFPGTKARLGNYPMWSARAVYRWLSRNPPHRHIEPLDLIGYNGILDMLEEAGQPVTFDTLTSYYSRGDMPHEDARLGRSPQWKTSTIQEWIASRPGLAWAAGTKKAKPSPLPRDVQASKTDRAGNPGGASQLSSSDVVALREAIAAGEKLATVAERFRITPQSASSIARGEHWKDVGGPITRQRKVIDS